jgi:cell division protease FtsH
MDDEVRSIVTAAHARVVKLLNEERIRLDSIADALLERETLDEDEAYAAARVERPREETLA